MTTVVDGELTPRLVNGPFARHHPELADAWYRRGARPARLSAHRLTVAFTRGQGTVVILDDCLGGCVCHRARRDQGGASRGEDRITWETVETALPQPSSPGLPQALLGIKPCHVSMLAYSHWLAEESANLLGPAENVRTTPEI
jgi:hypothetical protein